MTSKFSSYSPFSTFSLSTCLAYLYTHICQHILLSQKQQFKGTNYSSSGLAIIVETRLQQQQTHTDKKEYLCKCKFWYKKSSSSLDMTVKTRLLIAATTISLEVIAMCKSLYYKNNISRLLVAGAVALILQ